MDYSIELLNVNYFKYTRTEMYYNYILPITNVLYDSNLTTDDKLIEINKLIELFHKEIKK